jgi:hypothetical protein
MEGIRLLSSKKYQNIKFNENSSSVETELLRMDGQTVAFCIFANAPKDRTQKPEK